MSSPVVRYVSECFVKPLHASEESGQPLHLSPWDLAMLSVHYIQKGLLFPKPRLPHGQDYPILSLLQDLKASLSAALSHFHPLAARLSTVVVRDDPPSCIVRLDPAGSPGARFVHAAASLAVSDVLSPEYVPSVVRSFFDHDRAVNHDGHVESLLTVQVTELVDGVFIGCSINHAVGDGSSFWHFFNAWSEIFNQKSGGHGQDGHFTFRPPVHRRWVPDGYGPVVGLPFNHRDQFVSRYDAPQMQERIFHFTSDSLAKIKAKANSESGTAGISTLQALSAFMWRCVTRVRNIPADRQTSCRLATNNRRRLSPPLPDEYFGNSIQTVALPDIIPLIT